MSQEHHPSIFENFLDEDGRVVIGGKPADEWLEDSDRPHFLYSRSLLEGRIAHLRKAMPDVLGLHYAVKSNPFAEILQTVDPLVDGFDIASIGELRRLIAAGCKTTNISFAGPGKSRAEILEAAAHSVKIIVESPHQLGLCESVGRELGKTLRVMVRVNDQKARPGGGLSMAGANTVFGWELEDFQTRGVEAFEACDHVEFWGLHIFYGSQILQAQAIGDNLRISVETIKSLRLPRPPKLINLGGGLGIPYGPKDVPIDIESVTPSWIDSVNDLNAKFPGAKICVELGRYISAPIGIFVMQVLDKKRVGETEFLVCSGGLQNFAAATGNFGQVLKRNHPLCATENLPVEKAFTVTGPLCTPMDVFARNLMLSDVRIGDYLAAFQAGAYGITASPSGFLSHLMAVEKLVP